MVRQIEGASSRLAVSVRCAGSAHAEDIVTTPQKSNSCEGWASQLSQCFRNVWNAAGVQLDKVFDLTFNSICRLESGCHSDGQNRADVAG